MFPVISVGSLAASAVVGLLLGLAGSMLLRRANVWISAVIAVLIAALAPFVGHTAWLVGLQVDSSGVPTQGIHFQYTWTAFAVGLLLVTLVRILSPGRSVGTT